MLSKAAKSVMQKKFRQKDLAAKKVLQKKVVLKGPTDRNDVLKMLRKKVASNLS